MTETNEIEKEFEELERNDEWEDAFKVIKKKKKQELINFKFIFKKEY